MDLNKDKLTTIIGVVLGGVLTSGTVTPEQILILKQAGAIILQNPVPFITGLLLAGLGFFTNKTDAVKSEPVAKQPPVPKSEV